MTRQPDSSGISRRWLIALLAALAAAGSGAGATPPLKADGDPPLYGLWRNPMGSVTVRIKACGDQVCGTVTAANAEAASDAREAGYPNLEGMTLMRGTLVARGETWRGTVLVPDLGRSFAAHIELTDLTHAKVTGCIWHGLLCRSQMWRRV